VTGRLPSMTPLANSPFDSILPVIRPGSPEFAALTGMTNGLI
jgi:hypothetical protein